MGGTGRIRINGRAPNFAVQQRNGGLGYHHSQGTKTTLYGQILRGGRMEDKSRPDCWQQLLAGMSLDKEEFVAWLYGYEDQQKLDEQKTDEGGAK